MKNLIAIISVLLVLSSASLAGAAMYEFSGTFAYNSDVRTDVRQFNFNLANDVTDVRIWTDSYAAGNFDPVIALWTGSGIRIDWNDDLDPTMDKYDSYLSLANLSAGDYSITLEVSDNYPKSTSLADGFTHQHDGTPPTSLEDWIPPGLTGNYHAVFDAVLVPEPSTFLLFAGALLGIGMLRRKFKA